MTYSRGHPERTMVDHISAGRFGPACGLAFTALAVASAAVVPAPPETDAATSKIREYLGEHHDALGVSTALMALAALAIMAFLAYVYRQLRGDERHRDSLLPVGFLVASAAVSTTVISSVILEAVLVQHVASIPHDDTVKGFYALWDLAFHTAPAMAMAAALLFASAASAKSHTFPRWLTGVAVLASALVLVDVVEDLTSSGTNLGPLGLLGFGLVNVWIVGVAVTALAHRRERDLEPATTATG